MPNKSDSVEPTSARKSDGASTSKPSKFKGIASSEDSIKSKGIKQKIVNKVKSWSNREKGPANEDVEVDVAETDEALDSSLARARGSLENLHEVPSCSLRCSPSPKSSPIIPNKPASKSLFWDPFDKKGKRTKKDFKRNKKKNKKIEPIQNETACSTPSEGKSCLAKQVPGEEMAVLENEDAFSRYRYFPKNSKSVVFTNEVFVVYFNGEEVLGESKEPLKKDTEQQLRNKEMRQGHFLKTQEKYNLCLY